MTRKQKTVFIEKCHKDTFIPKYSDPEDAGADLAIYQDIEIKPDEIKLVPLGFKIAIPKGYEIQIRPRSSISMKTMLRIPNSPGTIDANYRNEVQLILHNTGNKTIYFKKGDRIAQIVLSEVPKANFKVIDNIKKIKGDRKGGLGSSKLNISELKNH